jgi:hypothetical protein
VRWFRIHLGRGDIEPASFERLAAYMAMAVLLIGFLVLVGAPVRQAWADIDEALSRISSP